MQSGRKSLRYKYQSGNHQSVHFIGQREEEKKLGKQNVGDKVKKILFFFLRIQTEKNTKDIRSNERREREKKERIMCVKFFSSRTNVRAIDEHSHSLCLFLTEWMIFTFH